MHITTKVTMANHTQATQPKNSMPKDVWIFMQEYHTSSLPPRVIWDSLVNHIHGDSRITTKPCLTIITPHEPSSETPRLARALIGVMDNRDYWEGTASELLSLIGDRGHGIPRLHNRLSAELMQTYITSALDARGITVQEESRRSCWALANIGQAYVDGRTMPVAFYSPSITPRQGSERA